MKQALHIFRKDARHLRWEIVLLLVTIFLFAWSEMRAPFGAWGGVYRSYGGLDNYIVEGLLRVNPIAQILIVALAIILVGRVVHAEALPGETQFWLTRPYSRRSLLGAKCLFLAAFLIVPMTLSDIALVMASGFRVSQYLPGLVWEQILRGAVVMAPALALASGIRLEMPPARFSRGLAWRWRIFSSTDLLMGLATPGGDWAALGLGL